MNNPTPFAFYTCWADMRRHWPKVISESRAIECPDGISRIIAMQHHTWLKAESLCERDWITDLQFEYDRCFEAAEKSNAPDSLNVRFEQALKQYFDWFYGWYEESKELFGIERPFDKPIRNQEKFKEYFGH